MFFGEALDVDFGQLIHENEEDGVGPAKADDVNGIAAGGAGTGGTIDGIVFFADIAIPAEI